MDTGFGAGVCSRTQHCLSPAYIASSNPWEATKQTHFLDVWHRSFNKQPLRVPPHTAPVEQGKPTPQNDLNMSLVTPGNRIPGSCWLGVVRNGTKKPASGGHTPRRTKTPAHVLFRGEKTQKHRKRGGFVGIHGLSGNRGLELLVFSMKKVLLLE